MSSAETAIAVLVNTTPVIVFTDPAKADELFAHIEQEIATFEYDLGSDKGRKAVASLAYKVSRTKTAIDDAGAVLIEDAQKTVKSVNVERKTFRDKLDALRDKARKPLDDWEAEEAQRKQQREAAIADIKAAGQILVEDTSATVAGRLADMQAFDISADGFGDFYDIAVDARKAAVESLTAAGDRLKREEADRAELERLRAANAEREAREAAERAEREKAERHTAYIRSIIKHIVDCGQGFIDGEPYPLPILFHELETKVVIDDTFGELRGEAEEALATAMGNLRKIEAEALERAEEAARQEIATAEAKASKEAGEKAERDAKAALEKQQREHDEALAEAAKEKADLIAEQKRKDEARAAEDQRNADAAAEQRRQEEARAADKKHRNDVMNAAIDAIRAETNIGDEKASKIVLAIAAGQIPNVTLKF